MSSQELSDGLTEELARRLLLARRTGRSIAPLTRSHPWLSIDDAYRLQRMQVAHWVREGRTVSGYKVGLVSAAMRAQMRVDEPDFGHVMDVDVRPAAAGVSCSELISPLAEPELGLMLSRPLRGPGVIPGLVRDAVEAVVPLIEVVDSRITDWDITIVDTVADNASSGAAYLGPAIADLARVDLDAVRCDLLVDESIVATGSGRDVHGSPLASAAWLANTLGRHGITLQPGQIILTGSMTRAVPLSPGSTVVARFGDLASVSLRVQPMPLATHPVPAHRPDEGLL